MSDDANLRAKVRELIRSGRLPGRRPERIRGGAGFAGDRCAICGAPVKRDEIALEVEVQCGDGAAPSYPHLHIRCFSVLDLELQRLEADGSGCRDAT
jgi:hypothetical protein